ncbi:hypothetical protein OBBRIDRAFT_788534, partial [Obba rivulosa]
MTELTDSSVFLVPSEVLQMHLYQPVLYDERGSGPQAPGETASTVQSVQQSPAHSSTAVCATLCAPPAPRVHFRCPAHTFDPLCAGLPPCAYLRLPVRTSATLHTYPMPC